MSASSRPGRAEEDPTVEAIVSGIGRRKLGELAANADARRTGRVTTNGST
jgi:hypothetical protein